MKFERTEIFNFEGAFRGLRNPLESWNKSDSCYCYEMYSACSECPVYITDIDCSECRPYIIGEKDLNLAQRMIGASASERKFMRQIFVSVDITAPLYWWKEFDTYKVGTVSNSTSTMHKLATTPITIDCFETSMYNPNLMIGELEQLPMHYHIGMLIDTLEQLRLKYLETKDKRYWYELIRWLPESWLQTRTVTMNYENLRAMYFDRRYHKLNEWSGKDNPNVQNFIAWLKTLPYAEELIMYEK